MKKVWKWVLGILLVLVIAALVAAPFVLRSTLGARFMVNPPAQGWMQNPHNFNGIPGPMMRNNPHGFDDRFGHMSPRMSGGYTRFGGFMPFGLGFFFIGGLLRLLPLALLGLLGYGLYQLGKRAGARSVPAPAPAAPVVPPAEPPAK